MMGWKGTLRSINAANNRYQKQKQKEQRAINALEAVSMQEKYYREITSLHTNTANHIDWEEIYNIEAPTKPKTTNHRELSSRKKLDTFKPNFLYKTLNLTEWKKKRLKKDIEKSIEKDKKEYNILVNNYKEELSNWNNKHAEAEHIVNKNYNEYLNILSKYQTFSNEAIGKEVISEINDNGIIELNIITANMDDIIPETEYTIRASGTLSEKKMAASKQYDYYQDYVCSSLIRVVSEIFKILPVDKILANTSIRDNNPMTGHMEDMTILSAYIDRDTFKNLNLRNIDTSEAMKNFKHNMKFKKTKGFEVVERIKV